jgi:hypothetical protein
MKTTLGMLCLPWAMVAVCAMLWVTGLSAMDTWMRWFLGGVTLYVLGLAIQFTRACLQEHHWLPIREHGHFHWHGHDHGKLPH